MDLLVKADPRYFKWLVALLAPALFIMALIALSHELRQYHFADIQAALERLPSWRLVVAVALTLTRYAVLTPYDRLGLAYAGRRLAQGRVVFASFCAYVFSYNIGFSVLGGAAVRYRLYTLWGLSALEIARLVLAGTTWLGFLAFKHVEYSNELWWRFEFSGHAPRFLRASVGVAALVTVIGLGQLFRPARQRPLATQPAEIDTALNIAAILPETEANLVALGDKQLLFSASRRSRGPSSPF